MQTLLLILGVVLLCGASVVFLGFAWGDLSLSMRSAVVAATTVAVFGTAAVANNRGL